MSKNILSQSEIDSLISAISAGHIEEDKSTLDASDVKAYDFRRPTKFTKEQIRTLKVIHDNYARILGNFLTAYLRVPVKIEVLSVSQVTYEEFISSLSIPTVVTLFNMSSDMGIALLEVNPACAFALIDLNFGGDGKSVAKSRELTEIELEVMRHLNDKLLENLSYVWKGIATLSPKIESIDTNPHFNQLIASSETIALVTLSIQIHDNKSMINFCFPYITLEKVISNLTAQHWFNEYQKTSYRPSPSEMEGYLTNAEVDIKALLGKTTITMEDFFQLQEGDVLQLNKKEGEPLELFIEDQLVLQGHPSLVEGYNLAIQVTDYVEGKGTVF